MFRLAAGEAGYRLFGLVMWAAATTSVVGSAFTSVSFIRTLRPGWEARTVPLIIGFIGLSTVIFLSVGRPVAVLILVGALNGLILPFALGAMLVAAQRKDLLQGYRHPLTLTLAGVLVALAMTGAGIYALLTEVPKLFQ
jgi:Mn2+/Fe2+ NRAMP family transporter